MTKTRCFLRGLGKTDTTRACLVLKSSTAHYHPFLLNHGNKTRAYLAMLLHRRTVKTHANTTLFCLEVSLAAATRRNNTYFFETTTLPHILHQHSTPTQTPFGDEAAPISLQHRPPTTSTTPSQHTPHQSEFKSPRGRRSPSIYTKTTKNL